MTLFTFSALLNLVVFAVPPSPRLPEDIKEDSVSAYLIHVMESWITHPQLLHAVCSSDGVEVTAIVEFTFADQTAKNEVWDSGMIEKVQERLDQKAAEFTAQQLLNGEVDGIFEAAILEISDSSQSTELAFNNALQSIRFASFSIVTWEPITLQIHSPHEGYMDYLFSRGPVAGSSLSNPVWIILFIYLMGNIFRRPNPTPELVASDDEPDTSAQR